MPAIGDSWSVNTTIKLYPKKGPETLAHWQREAVNERVHVKGSNTTQFIDNGLGPQVLEMECYLSPSHHTLMEGLRNQQVTVARDSGGSWQAVVEQYNGRPLETDEDYYLATVTFVQAEAL